jgi:hypothetical protein
LADANNSQSWRVAHDLNLGRTMPFAEAQALDPVSFPLSPSLADLGSSMNHRLSSSSSLDPSLSIEFG